MKRFHSYGPIEPDEHFHVPRRELLEKFHAQLLGTEKKGHYFTVWAPRQTGKSTLVRRVMEKIKAEQGERFQVARFSMQGLSIPDDAPPDAFLALVPYVFRRAFDIDVEVPPTWEKFIALFEKKSGLFERRVILLLDEFDHLPRPVIAKLVGYFRDIHHSYEDYVLHGLALIGVRAVLGIGSSGSPFNIQRSLHVPNLTREETADLFRQYQEQSGQTVELEVTEQVYEVTQGQPGLVGWFGELLTETHNPGTDRPIGLEQWDFVYGMARNVEWNNTVLNMVAKARDSQYAPRILELFTKPDMPFSVDTEWCNYLYLNGIIDFKVETAADNRLEQYCRFSSPFIQRRLYNVFSEELEVYRTPLTPLEPLDTLDDVFNGPELDLPALLERYKGFLVRLKAKGIDPWLDQPLRKTDLRQAEATGHFHLYAWLTWALSRRCVISPEFPTGNGKVDLHIRSGGKRGIIEVKSFRDMYTLEESYERTARYAADLGLSAVTLALFTPTKDDSVLSRLSGERTVLGVRICTVAIGYET